MDFSPVNARRPGSTLVGFCVVAFHSGIILHGVSIHERSGKAWAMPPSSPMISTEGHVLFDHEGKRKYTPVVSFVSDRTRSRWSAGIVAAFSRSYPGVLEGAQQ